MCWTLVDSIYRKLRISLSEITLNNRCILSSYDLVGHNTQCLSSVNFQFLLNMRSLIFSVLFNITHANNLVLLTQQDFHVHLKTFITLISVGNTCMQQNIGPWSIRNKVYNCQILAQYTQYGLQLVIPLLIKPVTSSNELNVPSSLTLAASRHTSAAPASYISSCK